MKKKEKKSTGKTYDKQQHNIMNEENQSHAADKKDNQQADAGTQETNTEDQPTDISVYQSKIDNLQKQLEETNEKFLRLFSEFDNYRKRVAKERAELTKTASESVITAMLPVLDDLERANTMDGTDGEQETQAKIEGVSLILNKFKSILRQKGVEEITAIGEDFNTDYHDAITHIPAEKKEQRGKVVEEVKKGYTLNGKVIRYASVIVAN